jgi:hypothetical protein
MIVRELSLPFVHDLVCMDHMLQVRGEDEKTLLLADSRGVFTNGDLDELIKSRESLTKWRCK